MASTETAITVFAITMRRALEKITNDQPSTRAQQTGRLCKNIRQGDVLKTFTEQQEVIVVLQLLKRQGLEAAFKQTCILLR